MNFYLKKLEHNLLKIKTRIFAAEQNIVEYRTK